MDTLEAYRQLSRDLTKVRGDAAVADIQANLMKTALAAAREEAAAQAEALTVELNGCKAMKTLLQDEAKAARRQCAAMADVLNTSLLL